MDIVSYILGMKRGGAGSGSVPYITTAPTEPNTDGGLIFVVLSEEPATYYDGYYYIITEE